MDITTALLGFSIAAALLTVTPGLDTALVLRTAAVEGASRALAAGAGIIAGVFARGLVAALGVGAVLAVSETAYAVLKIAGAAYLLWMGGTMLVSAFRKQDAAAHDLPVPRQNGTRDWFIKGLFTNLLNPKVGVFYVSFLPHFLVNGINPAVFGTFLAALHAVMSVAWFGLIILATRPMSRALRKPSVARTLDAVTGSVLVGFGIKLFLEKRAA